MRLAAPSRYPFSIGFWPFDDGDPDPGSGNAGAGGEAPSGTAGDGGLFAPLINLFSGDPTPTPTLPDPGIDPYHPSRAERNDWTPASPATEQWRADANLLGSVGYGGGEAAFSGPSDQGWIATVTQFQADNHITVDGKMGPQTRAKAQQVAGQQAANGGTGPAVSPLMVDPSAPPAPSPTLPLIPASLQAHSKLLYIGAGVAVLVVAGLLLTKKKGKKSRR